MIRVFIVDDHPVVIEGIHSLLYHEKDIEWAGQAMNAQSCLGFFVNNTADVVLMDISMPGMDGAEVTRILRTVLPQVMVVALSAYSDQQYVLDMLNAGASGYVTKAEASDELLRAIRTVLSGRTYLCPDVAGVVTGALVGQGGAARPTAVLGARERQVLKLVAEGCTSVQIADMLNIAPSTVEVHRRNIMRKLGRHSVAALTRYVVNNERGQRG